MEKYKNRCQRFHIITPDADFCDHLMGIVNEYFEETYLKTCSTILDFVKYNERFHSEHSKNPVPSGWSGKYSYLDEFYEKFDKHLVELNPTNKDEWRWVLKHLFSGDWGI